MPQFTVTNASGTYTVNASNAQAAAANVGGGTVQSGGYQKPATTSSSGGGGGGGGSTPAPSTSTGASAPSSGGPYYQTVNGPKTVAQMNAELAAAGWPGPPAGTAGAGATANAYAQTSGGAVSEMTGQTGPTTPAGTGPTTPAGTDYGNLLAQFAAQTSGVTDKQLAQQKAEFDAQLQFARDQMTQLGIPQLQINQYLAALQQQQFVTQLAQVQAQETGYYTAPNLPGLSMTGGANQPQATLGTGQGTPTLAAQAQWAQLYGQNAPPTPGEQTLAAQAQAQQLAQAWAQLYGYAPTFDANGQPVAPGGNAQTLAAQQQAAQLSGMYQGAPTEAAREFNQNLALQQGQLGQQYLATAAQLQGPQNTFQLSNYLRGAQGNQAVPTYLQNLSSNISNPMFQGTGSTAPTPQSAAGLAGQLGGTTSATPGWDYGQTLGTIQNIMNRGAQGLSPGALEGLSPDELAAFGSGLGAVGGSLPSFLQQYQQSRVGQSAAGTPTLA
jgi:hypothetical protein